MQRLLEVAQEADGKRVFLSICGWPALERLYLVKLAQTAEERSDEPLPEPDIVRAATVAIAQADVLIRFEATLQPKATVEDLGPVFALAKMLSCPTNPKPESNGAVIKTLEGQMSSGQSGILNPRPSQIFRANPFASEHGPAPGGPSSLASVNAASGSSWSEIQIAASADGQKVVVGSNGGTAFSGDYAGSFTAGSTTPGFSGGDPTLATGASGKFYFGGINVTSTACTDAVESDSSGTGSTFGLAGAAAFCPMTGAICFPDQPQMAADAKNAAPGGSDQLYVVWRDFPAPWWQIGGTCSGVSTGSPTPTISCSTNSGAAWGHQQAVGSGDWGRVTVGPDGFVYVTYASGGNVMLNKFSSCSSGLVSQPGFPVTVAGTSGVDCPISGLDRCNSNATASPQAAVTKDARGSVYVAYAEKNGSGNDDIVVRHSNDGGLTWPDRTTANSSAPARRFLPWICGESTNAVVSWYDRRAATASDNSLTNYFANTVTGARAGSEQNVSVNANSQNSATAPCCPKYGDYNGNVCTADRAFVGWASATAPPGVASPGTGISVFVQAIPIGPPVVTAVSPSEMQCGASGTIAIAGTNFVHPLVELRSGGLTVDLHNLTTTSNSITASIPSSIPGGLYDVTVYDDQGVSSAAGTFMVRPIVSGLNPNSGPAAGGTSIVVTGACFCETVAGVAGCFNPRTTFSFAGGPSASGAPATGASCASDTECTLYSPVETAAGTVDVIAHAAGASSLPGSGDRFTYLGPQITSIRPSSGPKTGGTLVAIDGSGLPPYDFHTLDNTPISFGGVTTVGQCDRSWCMVTSPAAATAGPVDIRATAFGAQSPATSATIFSYTTDVSLIEIYANSPMYPGGAWVAGVRLDGSAPLGGTTVALSSSNPTVISVPASVTVAAGVGGTTTPITVNPSPVAQAVTLTGSYGGHSVTTAVNVASSPALSVSIDAITLSVGEATNVHLSLNNPAPAGGAAIALSSSNPGAIAVPAAATIGAGAYSTAFPVTDNYASGPHVATISASYDGASASDSVTVYTAPPRCIPRSCTRFQHWDSTRCQCVAGIPTVR